MNQKKKLIIFGSSVAYGEGAENNNGWASILGENLLDNWEMINQSVCGNRAKHLLKRVHDDVVALQPDAVIIAISLGNEGLVYPFKTYRYNRFIRGIKELIQIFISNHIIPIVTNIYPNDYYKKTEYSYMERMNIELDALGVHVVNVSGTVDDMSGKWIHGLAFDSGHPNNQGHLEMSTAFPSAMFDTLEREDPSYRFPTHPLNISSYVGFRLLPAKDIRSFTMVLDVQPTSNGVFVTIDNQYSLVWSNGILLCNESPLYRPIVALNTYQVVISYHPYTQRGAIYVECSSVLEFTSIDLTTKDLQFNTAHANYYNIRLFRGRLSKRMRSHIYDGQVFHSSMEFYAVNLPDATDTGIENGLHTNTTIQLLNDEE